MSVTNNWNQRNFYLYHMYHIWLIFFVLVGKGGGNCLTTPVRKKNAGYWDGCSSEAHTEREHQLCPSCFILQPSGTTLLQVHCSSGWSGLWTEDWLEDMADIGGKSSLKGPDSPTTWSRRALQDSTQEMGERGREGKPHPTLSKRYITEWLWR